jgi:hypothetical protein
MSNFYELNMDDFKHLVKDLSKAGFSKALAGYKVIDRSIVKMDYIEYDRNPQIACSENLISYLFVNICYWQLHNDPVRKEVSINEVMKDIVNRSNLVLNAKHNLDKKNYDRNIEIEIDLKKSDLEISVHLITPVSTIYDVAKLNLFDLSNQNKKELENESI